MSESSQVDVVALSKLLQLEGMARKAESLKALQFLIANETRQLIPFRQAFVFSKKGKHSYQMQTASSISVLEKDAPFVRWLERFLKEYNKKATLNKSQFIDKASAPKNLQAEWDDYSLPYVLWVPLEDQHQGMLGGMWLARESTWAQSDMTLAKRLADAYAHAWKFFVQPSRFQIFSLRKSLVAIFALIILAMIMMLPVRLSALAPVEVVARKPVMVTSPMEGVIADISHSPNSMVEVGQVLFRYEDTTLRNQHQIAEKTLSVKQAELKKATQGAFGDSKSKSQIALLKSEVELAEAELRYAAELLDQVNVTADREGLLIYTDKDDWVGKPVRVGERIMQIANPEDMELRIDLPVDDAIALRQGAEVEVFLDIDPLRSLKAQIIYNSYSASLTASDVLAYKVNASLDESYGHLRIGLQGTAKVYGEKVSLFFYLFRRPISTIRQYIGI